MNLAVGEAVPLHALNTIGNEFDPFVTSDGLAIYFAADRAEGRGIFTAARPSPLHPFEEPRLLIYGLSGSLLVNEDIRSLKDGWMAGSPKSYSS